MGELGYADKHGKFPVLYHQMLETTSELPSKIHVKKKVFSENLGRNWHLVDYEKRHYYGLKCVPPNSYVEVLTPSIGILARRED